MTPLRWGILSTARIGLRRVIPAIQRSHSSTVVAIASRERERAAAVASRFGIPRAHGSYEELLADPEVEAIYNPLPNSLHADWSIRAARAGKHVLCEKPLAGNADQAARMVEACARAGVLLQEAFMYRFHPQIERLLQLVHEGAIGRPWLVRSAFTFTVSSPQDIRLRADLAGGGLMDVGCYCVNLSRLLLGEPSRVHAAAVFEHGVDVRLAGMLRFPHGMALFDCGLRLPPRQFCEVVGEEGVIVLPRPFQPEEVAAVLTIRRGDREERIEVPGTNQYVRMVDHFSQCVRQGTPPRYPPEDAVANMRVLDLLQAAAGAEHATPPPGS
ncbi:MAG: Gfo/Idh/MocA family oxidoreductase [Armatimonadota bacterium]|nr:Gfo/Idh/MocA family oxidoreductase [Armatimonadota bacterium]MDR7464030.1 Gfo/Idh/MocA family oxidoreductase [Armatimonadota bacterium]MDR7471111.1 Gfo/Idh/MocA family oxidoreductase [Armatimonadota bacterium]MDR7476097.1 Gfo/Idh/MocA family oxidoreductase [Armatimonadota bacterium]MDR7538811.1 Gfo/Idh/MocA family oxidoreductase [Armatimonadota bacterium]